MRKGGASTRLPCRLQEQHHPTMPDLNATTIVNRIKLTNLRDVLRDRAPHRPLTPPLWNPAPNYRPRPRIAPSDAETRRRAASGTSTTRCVEETPTLATWS